MPLSDKDLEKIGQIVDEKINKAIDTKVPVMIAGEIGSLRTEMNQGFGSLRLEINQRFDDVCQEMSSNHREVLEKIEEVKQMETEDIQVIYKDVALLKKKMAV
ncbi:MAG: hypothetical protein WCP93_03185 [Candidatus Berkelbacteria bacterium]